MKYYIIKQVGVSSINNSLLRNGVVTNEILGILPNNNEETIVEFINNYYFKKNMGQPVISHKYEITKSEYRGNIYTLISHEYGSVITFEIESCDLFQSGVHIDFECDSDYDGYSNPNFVLHIKTASNMKYGGTNTDTLIFKTDMGYDIGITYHHDVGCCEYNYIDFSGVGETLITEIDTDHLKITAVPDYGIKVNGIGIPAYSEQNGYYSCAVGVEILKLHDQHYEILYRSPEFNVIEVN